MFVNYSITPIIISLLLFLPKSPLEPNQFLAAGSECIWTFNVVDGNLTISVNTNKNIIYSEFPNGKLTGDAIYENLLEFYIGDDINFETKTKPLHSKSGRWYYTGKITWSTKSPPPYKGHLLFKECTTSGKCLPFRQINFSFDGYKWRFYERKK